MKTREGRRFTVIGVGNAWRRDDAAGLLVARQLKAQGLTGVEVRESPATGTDIYEAWKGAAGAIVVDAVTGGGPPGTIYRFEAHDEGEVPLQGFRSASSHGWGVAEALGLGRVFRELPPRLIIYGIEGKDFQPGQVVSPEVAAAIPEVVARVRGEIQAWLRGDGRERK
jgi:hydrogenase maturation protease